MSAIDLLQAWQESLNNIQLEKFYQETLGKEELLEANGLQVQTSIRAGQLFSLLTICRCED